MTWGFVGFLRALGLQCSISGLLSSNQPAEMLCESVGSSASCCSYCISCSSPVVKVFLLRSHPSVPRNLVLEVGGLLGGECLGLSGSAPSCTTTWAKDLVLISCSSLGFRILVFKP